MKIFPFLKTLNEWGSVFQMKGPKSLLCFELLLSQTFWQFQLVKRFFF